MDFASLIPWLCTGLNAAGTGDLLFWTEAELYRYAEEALHDIGGRYLLLAEYDDATELVPNQAIYELPDLHIATIFAAVNGAMLRPTGAAELEALDDNYEEAAAVMPPARWCGNVLGLRFIRLYPPPSLGGALELILHQHPAALASMPEPIADYLVTRALQAARERQGDGQMQDAAGAFGMLAKVYEKAMEAYWGHA